jgi:NAD(P)-dependent dehydrogenase (short-subunit alcohol dehydrogenase family)
MSEPSVFRPDLLAGKHAFLTGGTSGINLAIAARFAEAGAAVTVLGRNPEKAENAAEELRSNGARALAVTADVRDYGALSAALAGAVAAHGPIDVLVCGAAGNFAAPALAMSANAFKAVIDIDLLGTFNASRAAFEHLRKPGASVLTISATQSLVPALLQSHVCAAKAGIDHLVRVLAMEWGPLGVRVNSLAPGPIEGTEGMERLASNLETRAKLAEQMPLRRFGTKREIAEIALFLASPAASLITGALLVADGGQVLGGFGTTPMLG